MGLLFFLGAYYSDKSYNYGYRYVESFDSLDFGVCVKILFANDLKEKVENLP
jgi:hypothetical protein